MGKLRPTGRIWSAYHFDPARQTPCTCAVTLHYITMYFNDLLLHTLCKSHCIWSLSGQAVAKSDLGSKSLTTAGLEENLNWSEPILRVQQDTFYSKMQCMYQCCNMSAIVNFPLSKLTFFLSMTYVITLLVNHIISHFCY